MISSFRLSSFLYLAIFCNMQISLLVHSKVSAAKVDKLVQKRESVWDYSLFRICQTWFCFVLYWWTANCGFTVLQSCISQADSLLPLVNLQGCICCTIFSLERTLWCTFASHSLKMLKHIGFASLKANNISNISSAVWWAVSNNPAERYK